jgi:hypothetical protein
MFPEFQKRSQNTDVIILSETWLDEGENVYLKGFDVVRKETNENAGGGVAIFVNNKLKYSRKDFVYDDDGKIEAYAIELFTGQDKILILSCYKQQMKIKLKVWRKYFAQFKGKFLIGRDFNGHHHSWVIRKIILPATTCTILSPDWKQT